MTDARRRADVNHCGGLIEQKLDIVHESQEWCRELHMQVGRVVRDDSRARELCQDRGQSLPSIARCPYESQRFDLVNGIVILRANTVR